MTEFCIYQLLNKKVKKYLTFPVQYDIILVRKLYYIISWKVNTMKYYFEIQLMNRTETHWTKSNSVDNASY